jgi:hypothetical protein
MDLETIIIGILSLTFFIVPIVLIQRNNKKKKGMLLQDFRQLAGQQQLSISQHDSWDTIYTIGIDSDQKKLLYTRKREGKDQEIVIDLAEVSQCRVNNLSRETNGNKVIDRIELAFLPRHAKQPEQTLEFYSREESLNLSEELKLSEKWHAIVNSHLAASPATRLARSSS